MQHNFKNQFPKNLFTNILVFLVSSVINLFLTPFYINHIGIDGFGLIKLALTIPAYTGLAMIIVSGSVSRFLTIEIQNNNIKKANKIFNTTFIGISGLVVITTPILIFLSLNMDMFINIPDKYNNESTNLFLLIFMTSFVTAYSTLFLIPANANNRLDIINNTKIISVILQSLFVVIAFKFFTVNISIIGLAYLIGTIVVLISSLIVWKKFAKYIEINYKSFDYKSFKEMSSMSSWLLINQLGSILFLSIDLLIINYFFGSSDVGEYSIILQLSILLRTVAGVIAGVFAPMIYISYAKGDFKKIIELSNLSLKFISIILAIPIGLITGFSASILELWVGDEFIHLSVLLCISLLHLSINLAVLPLFSVNSALNKVKIPGLVSLGMGILNLTLAISFSLFTDLKLYGIAIASAIVLTLKNLLFQPIYTSHILNIPKYNFILKVMPGIIITLIIFISALTIEKNFNTNDFINLLISSILITLISLPIIWFLIISKKEKHLIIEIFLKKFKKVKNEKNQKNH